MTEHLFEYISIIILLSSVGLYLARHKIKSYFKSPSIQISQASFGKRVQNGYITLLNLSYHNSDKEDLEREIRDISIQRGDGRYVGGYSKKANEFDAKSFVLDYFYEILNYTDSKNENFIFSVDSSFNIEELNYKLQVSLASISKNIELPYLSNIDIESTMLMYKEKLNQENIQMTFVSDGSDTYYFVLHPLSKEKDVIKAIGDIGLDRIVLN